MIQILHFEYNIGTWQILFKKIVRLSDYIFRMEYGREIMMRENRRQATIVVAFISHSAD